LRSSNVRTAARDGTVPVMVSANLPCASNLLRCRVSAVVGVRPNVES
jgi:hypothetical protein